MSSIGLNRRVLVALACMMMVSCEGSEEEGTSHRSLKQAEGGCTNPYVSCGDETNLITTSVTSVVLAPNFVMIPRSTWDTLIAEQPDLGALQASNTLRQQAVRAASTANDPMASGVFADEVPETEGGSFDASDILVVVDDPLIDPNSKRVYATNYFIAAVGLQGLSNWTRRGVKIAVEPTMMSGGGRCCGPENIGEQLEPVLGPGTEPPDCSGGTNAYCAGWNTRLRPSWKRSPESAAVRASRSPDLA